MMPSQSSSSPLQTSIRAGVFDLQVRVMPPFEHWVVPSAQMPSADGTVHAMPPPTQSRPLT